MADVFISYKKEDRHLAEQVVGLLRADGLEVWWDDGITPHQAWDNIIEQQLNSAKAVIVLWSPQSVASEWVRSEAHFAQEQQKLIPVMIENCQLPIAFSLRQAIDLTGDLEANSHGWQKLRHWLEGVLGDRPLQAEAPLSVASPASPAAVSRAGNRGWKIAAGAAAALAIAGGFGFYHSSSAAVQADVLVDPIAMPAGDVLPAGFASDLNDEMFATFSSSSRITPRNGDGKRISGAYQVGGRVDTDKDNVRLYFQIYAPSLDAPILTSRLEHPRSSLDSLPHQFGFTLAQIVRCIATASDSNGAAITTLPLEAAKAWAKFCSLPPDTPSNGFLPSLRATVAAAPDFANGWSNLAEILYVTAHNPDTTGRSAIIKEAGEAADRAIALDETTAKAFMVKAWIALPNIDPESADSFPHYKDFAKWQEFSEKSLSVRPSDCGCETTQYGFSLITFGRVKAALPYIDQEKAQTGSWDADVDRALILALLGRNLEAKEILDDVAKDWPTESWVTEVRGIAAIIGHDWAEAAQMIEKQTLMPGRDLLLDYFKGQSTGSKAASDAAAEKLVRLLAEDGRFPREGAMVLAHAGRAKEAITASEKNMMRSGRYPMIFLWTPDFAEARRTPEFAALIKKTGLPAYWRIKGNEPDFCTTSDTPAICKSLGSS